MKKFFKNLFHRHQWKTIGRAKGKADMSSLLFGRMGKVDVALCLDRCECGKERAYMSTHEGDQAVGLNYAKSILGI